MEFRSGVPGGLHGRDKAAVRIFLTLLRGIEKQSGDGEGGVVGGWDEIPQLDGPGLDRWTDLHAVEVHRRGLP